MSDKDMIKSLLVLIWDSKDPISSDQILSSTTIYQIKYNKMFCIHYITAISHVFTYHNPSHTEKDDHTQKVNQTGCKYSIPCSKKDRLRYKEIGFPPRAILKFLYKKKNKKNSKSWNFIVRKIILFRNIIYSYM